MMSHPPAALRITTPSDLDIVITREFAAPRRLVWDALTKPALLRRWLFGPPGWEMTTCDEDLRVGGSFRWAWRGPNGEGLAMEGVYREIVPTERVVRTERFDVGCPSQMGEQVATLVLSDRQPGKTVLTITVRYPSKAARDGALASGMEKGMAAGYDRLDELLQAGV
jgi:uncharacterized protein YndB with AHSA1/START domain